MNSFIETLNHWGGNFLDFAWPMLWQSSLLIVVLLAFDFVFRRKIRASIRYALWLVVLVKLCLPPTLALPTSPAWWVHKTPPPPAATPATLHYTVTYGSEPLPTIPQYPLPAFAPPKPAMTNAAWLLVSSAAISSALLLWLLARWWQITRQVRRASISERLSAIAGEAQKSAGIKSKVQIKLTANSMSPAVCGLFRPAILIPQSLAENFSDEQLRAVLLHELIHLRRRDVWLNFVQALLQVAYWWHPLLWLANARIRRVREEAVDDTVMLALRDGAESYAPTLLEVAKLALNRPLASLGLVGILESRSALRQRIERLVDFRPPRKAGLTLVSLLGIVAFTAVAVPMGGAPEQTTSPISSGASSGLNQTNSSVSTTNNFSSRTNSFEEKVKPDRLVQDARLDYETGKLNEAEKLLKSALALDSENVGAKYYLNLVQSARQNLGTNQNKLGRQNIVEKLNRIRLDNVSYDGLPLSEVIRQLSEQSKLRDPEKEGIEFLINPNPDTSEALAKSTPSAAANPATGLPEALAPAAAPTEITPVDQVVIKLNLTNVRLADLLDAIVMVSDHPIKYSVMDYGVVFSKESETPRLYERTFNVDPNIFFSALKGVNPSGRSSTNNGGGVEGGASDGVANITVVTLQSDISLAARSFFTTLGIDMANPPGKAIFFNDRLGVLFVKATLSDLDTIGRAIAALNRAPQISETNEIATNLRERMFRVDPHIFISALYSVSPHFSASSTNDVGGPGNGLRSITKVSLASDVSFAARNLFTNIGVDMANPPGKSVFFNDGLGLLFVKATASDLDTIGRAIAALNQGTQQIHIKARFVEGPKKGFVDPPWLTNNAVGGMMGILTSGQAQSTLRMLETKPGFEILGEPEAISTSGRQTQMRATQVITVITNYAFQESPTNGPGSVSPQLTKVETGPVVDVVPYVLSDGYTINLAVNPSLLEFLGYDTPTNVVGLPNRPDDQFVQFPVVLPAFRLRHGSVNLNLWDGQTVVLGGLSEMDVVNGRKTVEKSKASDKELLVFITATIVDPAGNRIHSDEDMPFAKDHVPPQPPH